MCSSFDRGLVCESPFAVWRNETQEISFHVVQPAELVHDPPHLWFSDVARRARGAEPRDLTLRISGRAGCTKSSTGPGEVGTGTAASGEDCGRRQVRACGEHPHLDSDLVVEVGIGARVWVTRRDPHRVARLTRRNGESSLDALSPSGSLTLF
jgi:hypothetical protein